jgi:hypothetical protein
MQAECFGYVSCKFRQLSRHLGVSKTSNSDFDIIFLAETWLNNFYNDHDFFHNRYAVYRSDRLHTDKACGDGCVLTSTFTSLGSFRRRYDLKLCSECVWVEIPTVHGINFLIGKNFFFTWHQTENYYQMFLPSWKHSGHQRFSLYFIRKLGELVTSAKLLLLF